MHPMVAGARAGLAGWLVAALLAISSAPPLVAQADEVHGAALRRHDGEAGGEATDGFGPGFGAVAHGVDDEGTLRLAVSLRGAAPATSHELYLVCGPAVEAACGYARVGLLVTDERGDADSGELAVPPGTLAAEPFGAGARRDHLTVVDWATNTAYVSASLEYAVP
jgi:hypothetical protein